MLFYVPGSLYPSQSAVHIHMNSYAFSENTFVYLEINICLLNFIIRSNTPRKSLVMCSGCGSRQLHAREVTAGARLRCQLVASAAAYATLQWAGGYYRARSRGPETDHRLQAPMRGSWRHQTGNEGCIEELRGCGSCPVPRSVAQLRSGAHSLQKVPSCPHHVTFTMYNYW